MNTCLLGFGVSLWAAMGCGADGGVGASELPQADVRAEVGEIEVDEATDASDSSDASEETDASDVSEETDGSDVSEETDASLEADGQDDADVGETADQGWREALPLGSVVVAFALTCETVACNPTCGQPLGASAGFGLTLTVPEEGPVTITYTPPEFPSSVVEPVAVNEDGTYLVSVEVTQVAATNVFTVAGHVGPGRTLSVDSYAWMILQTNGFMAGWTTTKTATAGQTQSF